MKNFILKFGLIISVCIFAIPNVKANVNPRPATTKEVQPFALIDNKISFYTAQIDFESIQVKLMGDDIPADYSAPKFTYTPDNTMVTIDFSDCEEGTYLITGTRGELDLAYSVALKK